MEAMACGLPVVSFRCQTGPEEIVRHGVDGYLVAPGDVDALAADLDRLMANADARAEMGRRASEVSQRFSEELFFRRWEAVLQMEARG
jgi:glycosyltransferase involved in cell wall biosynthesis